MPTAVEFARIREAPEDILERLRVIDPGAELLYWGPRMVEMVDQGRPRRVFVPVWMLGVVQPNAIRRQAGARTIALHEAYGAQGNRDSWRYGKLLYQHFAPIAFYPMRDPTGEIVEDFRLRDWMFRNRFEAEGERLLAEAEGIPQLEMRVATAIDKARGDGPGVWHFSFGKRRHFSMR